MTVERLLGHIGVDSGIVAVGDPCYLVQGGAEHSPEWQEVVAEVFDAENPRRVEGTSAVEVEAVMMTTTPQGDGLYPVFGVVDEETGRVLALTVRFADPA
ncbi:MAG TPA: hypothetical protein VMT74_03185 [Gaiellaceae bacterium]|nr:hypothetical protein [Gaiellaceae bacterium]